MWLSLALFVVVATASEPGGPERVEATVATATAEPLRAGVDGLSLQLERLLHQHASEASDLDLISVNIERGIDAPSRSVLDLRDETWDALFGSHVLEVRRGIEGTPRPRWSASATPSHTIRGREAVDGLCVQAGARAADGELELLVDAGARPPTGRDRSLRRKHPAWAFWSAGRGRRAATTIQPGEAVTVVQVLTGELDGQPDTRLEMTADDWRFTIHEAPGASQVCVSYGEANDERR